MRAGTKCALVAPIVLGGVLSFAGCATHSRGVVYLQTGPPEPIVEVITVSPGAGYVWVTGYHKWDGVAYVWVPGHYQLAPRARAVWVPGRWRQGRRGWYWVNGRWR